jgi:hypothetical protein
LRINTMEATFVRVRMDFSRGMCNLGTE